VLCTKQDDARNHLRVGLVTIKVY